MRGGNIIKKRLRDITLEDYGISKERYNILKKLCQSGQYEHDMNAAAYMVDPNIAPFILLSVKKNKSYDSIEYTQELGRIPYNRTEFYAYRRYFYYLLDKELTKL